MSENQTAIKVNLSTALSIFEDQLPDIRKSCVENIRAIQAQYSPYKELHIDDEYTREAIHQHANWLHVQEKTQHYVRTIKRIDSKRQHYASTNTITEEDIARAKEIPISELYDGQLFGRKRKTGLCPFHNEKTPSFHVSEKNYFKCFGCQVHGSAIDFIMLRDGKTFVEAVKILRGR